MLKRTGRIALLAALAAGVLVVQLGGMAANSKAQTVDGPTPSPYAGQQGSSVRGLTDEEIADLRTGSGMGLARPAELNSYPGPRHVLDLADE
jgi:hypothetical protein